MAQGHDQVNEVLQATDIVEVIGELGRYAESRAACKAAIAIKPDHAGPMVWQVVQ